MDTPIWRPSLSRPELRDASMSGVLALSIPAMAPDTEAAQCARTHSCLGPSVCSTLTKCGLCVLGSLPREPVSQSGRGRREARRG